MRVFFFSAGASGSERIVRGLAAEKRRIGVLIEEMPFKGEAASGSAQYRDSRTFVGISAFKAESPIVDLFRFYSVAGVFRYT